MVFFICMFICNLLIPATMIIAGYFMYKKPPKEINGVIGYRTTMSRKIWIPGNLHMTIVEDCG